MYFSDISLLVYRTSVDFGTLICILQPYCVYFLFLIVFWEKSLGFSIYRIMSSAKNDTFTSSFPIWMLFISFSCLIALVRTFSTMLNKSGKSRHPFLFLSLYIFWERPREKEREGEKHWCVTEASVGCLWKPLIPNSGMGPYWESNQWPFGSQASAQPSEAHQWGLDSIFLFLILG